MTMRLVRNVMLAAASLCTAFVMASDDPVIAQQAPPRRFVIDSHQHWRSSPDYIPSLVKVYRPLGAMACVLTPIASLDQVVQAARQHPDVVIPYGYLDVDHPDARAHVERFVAAGVKGIKMHRPKYNWDDFGYFPLYARMQEKGILALFHTGIVSGNGTGEPEQSSMARMRPSFLHTIARSFPSPELAALMDASIWKPFRLFLGVAEVAAGIGLVVPGVTRIKPWLVPLAAALLLPIMIGATVSHISRAEYSSSVITALLVVLLAAVAYLRWKVKPIPSR